MAKARAVKKQHAELPAAQEKDIRRKKRRKRKILTIIGMSLVLIGLLLCLAWIGLEEWIRSYLRKLDIVDFFETESQMALGETLPPESGIEALETESLTDSPSQEIADLLDEIDIMMSQYQGEKETAPDATRQEATEAPTLAPGLDQTDILNILLIGVDSRDNNGKGRSDAMIILTINKRTKEISMTSLMRDIYVGIEGRDPNRLNAAHAYGGANLLLKTIEINFGIHIDYYVRVNFFSFMQGVDALGGIYLDVDEEERYWLNGYLNELNGLQGLHADTNKLKEGQTGRMLLNGSQALAYARIRYVGSDYARTQRQREVILSAIDGLKGLSLSEMDSVLNTVLPLITTNMQEDMLLDLVMSVPAFLGYEIKEYRIPVDGTYYGMQIDGMSVIRIDFAANRTALRNIIYGK